MKGGNVIKYIAFDEKKIRILHRYLDSSLSFWLSTLLFLCLVFSLLLKDLVCFFSFSIFILGSRLSDFFTFLSPFLLFFPAVRINGDPIASQNYSFRLTLT